MQLIVLKGAFAGGEAAHAESYLWLQPGAAVRARGGVGRSRTGRPSLYCTAVELIRAAPAGSARAAKCAAKRRPAAESTGGTAAAEAGRPAKAKATAKAVNRRSSSKRRRQESQAAAAATAQRLFADPANAAR